MFSSLPDGGSSRWRIRFFCLFALLSLGLVAGCGSSDEGSGTSGGDGDGGKYRIALIQSYSGNDWQNSSANLIKATAATAPWKDKVEFVHHIAGTDPQKQSKLITDEISAGADALVLYPISLTAINPAIKKACDQGVLVVNYDSWTEEPCSYNVHNDPYEIGKERASWMAEHLDGSGTIAEITGVAGTAFDTLHQKGVDDALKDYPDIKLVAREQGLWAQPAARDAITKIMSAHPDLDGVIIQVGCWGATEQQIQLGDEPIPCAGNTSHGHLWQMFPKSELPGKGINLPSIAVSETTYTGGLAFLQAFNMLEGGEEAQAERCHETVVPPVVYRAEDLKLGEDETQFGNVFPPDHKPEIPPGMLANYYTPLIGQGLLASLTGKSDQVSEPIPPELVGGDDNIDGTADEKEACLVP